MNTPRTHRTLLLAGLFAVAAASAALAQPTTTAKPAAPTKPAAAAQPAGKQPDPKQPAATPDMDAEMAAWMAAAQPGEQHKALEKMAGEWSAKVTSNWGPTPETSDGTLRARMTMGGRFLVSNFRGTMMGQPFVGQHTIGFNNMTRKFETTWRDSMGTGIMMETGTADASGKVITTSGEMAGPNGTTAKQRTVTTIGDGTFTVQMFMPGPDGKEAKMMEIVYTRTKLPGRNNAGDDDMDEMETRVKKQVRDATDSIKPK